MLSPGHTLASVTYLVDEVAFEAPQDADVIGDTDRDGGIAGHPVLEHARRGKAARRGVR
jgi:hypothetical protein